MNALFDELSSWLPGFPQVIRVFTRLLAAALLGAVVGYQRERVGKAAGLRTHMLVAMGAALFVVASSEFGMSQSDLSRVIQGLATGIGFLGAGAILKLADERDITGLTTAAGIWMTAALGIAAGLGQWASAGVSIALTWIILTVLLKIEIRNGKETPADKEHS